MSNPERDLNRVNTKVREKRREEADTEWKLDPIDAYENEIDHLLDSDINSRMNPVRRFDAYLENVNEKVDHEVAGPRDAVRDDIEKFIEDELMPDPKLGESTMIKKLGLLKSFYKELNKYNAFAGNPVTIPLENLRDKISDDTDRPYIPRDRIEKFLNWLDTQFARALWILAFKYGLRSGESINLDLCCAHIDHPIFTQLADQHDLTLHNAIRDRPDTIFVYGHFNRGEEINGEVRNAGNKRKQDDGSVLPLDSETKTALIDWLLVRPSTVHFDNDCHPLFAIGAGDTRRVSHAILNNRLWSKDGYADSIRQWQRQESLAGEDCPTCNENQLTELNLKDAERPGRRYRCSNCTAVHWRSIFWGPLKSTEPYDEFDETYDTAQTVKYHQGRHSFSSAHSKENSDLHDEVIPKTIRTEAIRGDSNQTGDTEDQVYIEGKYQDFERDVREVYLNNIWKFGVYNNPIPAVSEGWEK